MACARPPTALRGEFSPITVADARARPQDGARVRWGGELVRTTPQGADDTCLEIVDKPLDRTARPQPTDTTRGRFVACARGTYDPAVWAPGREVTAVGTLDGTVQTTIGERRYDCPRVAVEAVHLWPPRTGQDRAGRASGYIGGGGGGWGTHVGVGVGVGF